MRPDLKMLTGDEVDLVCQQCGHAWRYDGRAVYYASCPGCPNKQVAVYNKAPREK